MLHLQVPRKESGGATISDCYQRNDTMENFVQCQKPDDQNKRARRDYSTKMGGECSIWQAGGNDDMLFEVFKHLDSKSLAIASCVSRRWRSSAQDENLWEGICTRHWPVYDSQSAQLRSVVLALGGFRRLYVLYLWPLLCRQWDSNLRRLSCAASCGSPRTSSDREWSKDEVHLSLSLFSIDCYERLGRRPFGPTPLKFLCKPALLKQSLQCKFSQEISAASPDIM